MSRGTTQLICSKGITALIPLELLDTNQVVISDDSHGLNNFVSIELSDNLKQ